MEIEPNRVPTATLLPASSSDACGIRRVAAKYTKICNTAAAAPHRTKSGRLTLWAMLDASGRQNPTSAPPKERAQARLPFLISYSSRTGVIFR